MSRSVILFLLVLSALRGVTADSCSADNCLRAVRGNVGGAVFCNSYISPGYATPSSLPAFLAPCSASASRLSSACACLATTTLQTVTTSTSVCATVPPSTATETVTITSLASVTVGVTTTATATDTATATYTATETATAIETDTATTTYTATETATITSIATSTLPAQTITSTITDTTTDTTTATTTTTTTAITTATITKTFTSLYTNSPNCIYFGNGNTGFQHDLPSDSTNASAVAACENICNKGSCAFITVSHSYSGTAWFCYTYPAGQVFDPTSLYCTPAYETPYSVGYALS